MTQGISRRELARRLGVDREVIRRRIESGLLAPAVLPDDSLDPAIAMRILKAASARGKLVPDELRAAKLRRLRAQTGLIHDETTAFRTSLTTTAQWENIMYSEKQTIRRILTAIRTARVAGLTSQDARPVLADRIREALVELSEIDPPSPEDSGEATRIDLENMSVAELETLRQNLLAEKDELKRSVAAGDMIDLAEAAAAWGQRCAVAKSILTSMPGDPALDFTGCDEAETAAKLDAAVERVLGALDD